MTTSEIANQLVSLCRRGQYAQAVDSLYASHATSTEPVGEPRVVEGIEGIRGKGEWFRNTFEVKGQKIEGPIVSGKYFTVRFVLDSVNKETGEPTPQDEIAVYKVEDGKIVSEQFFYHAG